MVLDDIIYKGKYIGKNPPTANFIWHSCEKCGNQRWVKLTFGKPDNVICSVCSNTIKGHNLGLNNTGSKHSPETLLQMSLAHKGSKSPSWKGGSVITRGYREVKIYQDNPYYPMADHQNYVLEHRLVMAKHLGRCLYDSEVIHHRNENKLDNRISNLELTTRQIHINTHHIAGSNKKLYS